VAVATATQPLPEGSLGSAKLTVADLPTRFSAVEARERVLHGGSTEGGLALFLAQVGPGLVAAQPHQLQAFQAKDESLLSFLVYPVNRDEANYYDGLVGNAQALAEVMSPQLATSPTRNMSTDLTVHVINSSQAIAEASGGVTFPTVGLLNSTATKGPVMDLFVFRRGAVLAFILYQYDTTSSPTDVHDSIVNLGRTLDDRVKRAITPELAAPGPAVAKTEDPVLTRLANLTQSMLNWPDRYRNLEASGSGNTLLFALSTYRGRIRSYSALGTEDDATRPELAQLMVIYPLGADEQQTLDWVFQDPRRLAEYLLSNLAWASGVDAPTEYDNLYAPLSALEGVRIGDATGGIRLKGGGLVQDVVIARRGAALTVASFLYVRDNTPAVDAVKLAQTLDGGVAAALQGELPTVLRATRTPVPISPTATR
jgi:hypothetical protein